MFVKTVVKHKLRIICIFYIVKIIPEYFAFLNYISITTKHISIHIFIKWEWDQLIA